MSLWKPFSHHRDPYAESALTSVIRRAFYDDTEFRKRGWNWIDQVGKEPADYVLALPHHTHDPESVFPKLRWGGQVLIIASQNRFIESLAKRYTEEAGFRIDHGPSRIQVGKRGWIHTPRLYFLLARRVHLAAPGVISNHFTYEVRLVPHARSEIDYAVYKRVPDPEVVRARVLSRAKKRPDPASLERTIRKRVERIYPVLLTREVQFLRRLEQEMPEPYRSRVPRVLDRELDEQGYVRSVTTSWLRQGDTVLNQIEFARQAAEMLEALHEQGGTIHLDLRLDNILITRDGVCFVDFGSSVGTDEDVSKNSFLRSLFRDWLESSGIQQVMGRMIENQKITSSEIVSSHKQIDPTADLFYLTLQLNFLHQHEDYRGLVRYDPDSEEARLIKSVTEEVLRPRDPHHPTITTAHALRDRLEAVEQQLGYLASAPKE